jgi:hypothetical protein
VESAQALILPSLQAAGLQRAVAHPADGPVGHVAPVRVRGPVSLFRGNVVQGVQGDGGVPITGAVWTQLDQYIS